MRRASARAANVGSGVLRTSFQADGLGFTVQAGLVTYVHEPRADVDWDTFGAEPWRWLTASQTDTAGNRVVWAGEHLVTAAYGGLGFLGVAPAGDEHFLDVGFGYRDTAHSFVRADQGLVETIDQRLEWIEVRSDRWTCTS